MDNKIVLGELSNNAIVSYIEGIIIDLKTNNLILAEDKVKNVALGTITDYSRYDNTFVSSLKEVYNNLENELTDKQALYLAALLLKKVYSFVKNEDIRKIIIDLFDKSCQQMFTPAAYELATFYEDTHDNNNALNYYRATNLYAINTPIEDMEWFLHIAEFFIFNS